MSRDPDAPVNADVESYCWADNGWEDAGEGSVRDASTTTRGKAAADFAREVGDIRDVRVWKRYVRPWTLRECWDWYCNMRDWPEERPVIRDGWYPDEDVPVWEFVRPEHAAALPVWVCAPRGSRRPDRP